jgi:hypothetical protein
LYKRRIYIIFFITVLQANLTYAFEFEYTSSNTNMTAFFQDEMAKYVGILSGGQNVPFYISIYYPIHNELWELKAIMNVTAGSFIRLNRYFLLPLNITTSDIIDKIKVAGIFNWNILFNSGLIFQSTIGTIGMFVGYNYIHYEDKGEYTMNSDWEYYDSIRYTNGGMKFLMVPIINSSEFPIIGYILYKLAGYINLEPNNERNYSIKLISQPLKIGSVIISSITPYYSKKHFNNNAQISTYGLIANIDIQDKFAFFVDSGYKDHFDVPYVSNYYENTAYLRFGFPLGYDWQYKDLWQGMSFYVDKNFLVPKIGYIAQFRNSRALIEIGFYKYFEMTTAYRLNLADREYSYGLNKQRK